MDQKPTHQTRRRVLKLAGTTLAGLVAGSSTSLAHSSDELDTSFNPNDPSSVEDFLRGMLELRDEQEYKQIWGGLTEQQRAAVTEAFEENLTVRTTTNIVSMDSEPAIQPDGIPFNFVHKTIAEDFGATVFEFTHTIEWLGEGEGGYTTHESASSTGFSPLPYIHWQGSLGGDMSTSPYSYFTSYQGGKFTSDLSVNDPYYPSSELKGDGGGAGTVLSEDTGYPGDGPGTG